MAGLGKKTFTAGEVLTAADVNGYLMEQSVMVFGGTAARSSAVPTPSEGMISYLTDSDVTETFNGTAWTSVLNPPINAQAGTAYTFTRVDASRTVTASNGSASTYTIPPQADVAWPDGATLTLRNLGAGVVTIAGGSGVTVTNTAQTVAQYGSVKIIRTGSNAWTVLPDSGGASGLTLISSTTIGTGVSSVTVSNAFSSTYANYRIVINGVNTSTTTNIRIQFGATTTAYYGSQYYDSYGGGSTATDRVSNGASLLIGVTGNLDDTFSSLDVYAPNLAKPTGISGTFYGIGWSGWFGGSQSSNTQFTAFNILAGSGTMTGGTIRVYGYQNS